MSRRLIVCGLMFLLGASVMLAPRVEVAAQGKKGANQTQLLQQQLQQAATLNATLQQQVATLQAQNAKLQGTTTKKDKTDDKTDKKASTTLSHIQSAGLVHVVVLKLKSDTESTETQNMIDDAEPLRKIKSVRALWIGGPSDKGTPEVASKDYTLALTVLFDDADGLKKYLDDPAHTKFVNKHMKLCEKPVVYDYEPKKKAAAP